MSIFSDLPPVAAHLDTGHADATGLVHAWLFNAGTGTAVHDYVDDADATIANLGGAWDAGGGYDFKATADKVTLPHFDDVTSPWTLVAGFYMTAIPGTYDAFAGGSGNVCGLHVAKLVGYSLSINLIFLDGAWATPDLNQEWGTVTNEVEHVAAFHQHGTDAFTDAWLLGNSSFDNRLTGKLAFVYVYSGEVDTDLLTRLSNDPYAMFSLGSASPSTSASASLSPSASESTSPSPTGSVSPSASSSTSASRSASVSPSTSPSLSPSASVSGSSSSSTSASVSASASPSHADIDQYAFDGNPQIMLQYSDDGGHTWSEELWVSAGVEGAYAWRAMWRRLGKSRDRVWRVDMSDPVPWRILGAVVNVGKGTS